ncbi:MAG: alpha-glucan phosphorylase [Deltaproteobacteria bacterium RBG_16_49_23]|nr:MAG: alpha-glucan phosphorylase [Deltaproteobacteria bacterium RBG_16_49_23]
MPKDPVCGMTVKEEGLKSIHNGQAYYFCSEFCKNLFEKDPEKYVHLAGIIVAPGVEKERTIAYFSMEIAIDSRIPTYSGGLGILAGDTLRSCADLKVPVVGVTLLFEKGYFYQELDGQGNQFESPVFWNPDDFLKSLSEKIEVQIEGRSVGVKAWQYDIAGITGCSLPVIFLDTNLKENSDFDRGLTSYLYGGDEKYRLAQEIILGIGGIRMLRKLGYTEIKKYHMNEGHASLLVLELLRERKENEEAMWDFEGVRKACVFTTHTPVSAGHDRFAYDLVKNVLREYLPMEIIKMLGGDHELNMTLLALNLSHYVNGVAKKHGEVSRGMFPGYAIDSITNGIHSYTWTSDSFRRLYDKYIPGWAVDAFTLRYTLGIPKLKIWDAHFESKKLLIDYVNKETNVGMDYDTFTIGFARRATPYKRMDLVFSDIERLRRVSRDTGKIQFIFAGKAHPKDWSGKELIKKIFAITNELKGDVKTVYLVNYDMEIARVLVSGVDLWLKTPQRPLEASGTSGMKAVHNGIPNLSVLDGWWIEGHIEGVTGWSIGSKEPGNDDQDAHEIYHKLENIILPMYYKERERWMDIRQHSIALNASFFNTQRMVQQ